MKAYFLFKFTIFSKVFCTYAVLRGKLMCKQGIQVWVLYYLQKIYSLRSKMGSFLINKFDYKYKFSI